MKGCVNNRNYNIAIDAMYIYTLWAGEVQQRHAYPAFKNTLVLLHQFMRKEVLQQIPEYQIHLILRICKHFSCVYLNIAYILFIMDCQEFWWFWGNHGISLSFKGIHVIVLHTFYRQVKLLLHNMDCQISVCTNWNQRAMLGFIFQ